VQLIRILIVVCAAGCAAAGPAWAQRSARNTLQAARNSSWHVRVVTPADSAEGRVTSVFRDTVRLSEKALYVPSVVRVDRRVGDEWRNVWRLHRDSEASGADTSFAGGTSVFVYAGTTGLLIPGPYLPIPPPITAGAQFGIRDALGEFTVGARTLLYPAPLILATADIGRNFRSRGGRYSGVAIGGVFATEGTLRPYPMFSLRAGVLPQERSGGRVEFRGDALLAEGAAVILSLHLGFDTVLPR
jgi:hypothetical protein